MVKKVEIMGSSYARATGALSLVGFALSAYALYVEISKANDPSYTAMCDIAARISCSLVFTSEYGTGFGLVSKILGPDSFLNQPNGIIPHPLVALGGLVLGISGIVMSIYLGYALFIVLQDACVVCISTYLVNIGLFICSLRTYRAVMSRSKAKTTKSQPTKKQKRT
ncbi:Vitamin K epoxide reductase complex subunit 1 [Folsomia candida]|uniref:vitamin-K-epoxide reductase (warfarin-sensitive) n=1 Tax=Folsomia candida TaxID=158441 RepID=A0A226DNC1_FOLCA|nr:Vitamin K epoxide reductase complex subunit 1 [Folsomia candida]